MLSIGLNNIGNTCYLNSALQLLLSNNDFCDVINNNNMMSENLKTMSTFINNYKSSKSAITPNDVKNILTKKNKFVGNNQHDAGEFLTYLIDILNEDSKLQIDKLFEVKILSTVKCKIRKCLNISKNTENNNYLLFPIKNSDTTLDDCYRNFKSYEILDGDNMYDCNKCMKKVRASKRINILNWSKHLIIILKRFNNNGNKNNQDIIIPLEWRHNYILKGVVIHSGGTNGGHYVYINRNINGWTMCDDSNVYNISDEKAQLFLNKGYIYYYQQK